MALYGYARVSTIDQDLGLQEAALQSAGCEVIRAEKVTGSTREGRVELATLLDFLRKGDTLVVTRVDRLARSIGDLQDVVRALKGKGCALKATEQPIDTSTAAGKAFLDMLGVFAEFETNLRRERQMEGYRRGQGAWRLRRQGAAGLDRSGRGAPAAARGEAAADRHRQAAEDRARQRVPASGRKAGAPNVSHEETTAELERMAARLEASGEYKVLRRLTQGASLPSPPPGAKLGLVLDVETTGSDARHHEVIELAMVRFAYTPEGEVLGVHDTFQGYHEPSAPIPPEITALTGIDDAKVAGHTLDLGRCRIVRGAQRHRAGAQRRLRPALRRAAAPLVLHQGLGLHHERAAVGRRRFRGAEAHLPGRAVWLLLRQAPRAA